MTSVIVRYVRGRAGDVGVALMLSGAQENRTVSELEDPRSWSTHDQVIALLDAASKVTGETEIGRHVGSEILRHHDGTDVANLLRSLGSATELLRNVTAAAAKFSTVSTLEPLEVGDAHAVVRAITRPGFVRHPYLCEFTKGLLSQVPVLFGLVPAVVIETECQARGGRFCLYSVAWEERQWSSLVDEQASLSSIAWGNHGIVEAPAKLEMEPDTRIRELQQQLRQMGERLEEVFSTASDLLSVEDLTQLLDNIMRRAAGAVNAPRFLLVVRTSDDEAVQLHHHGFDETEADALAEELANETPDDAEGSRLIVDIASSRRAYGRLAAVYPPGMRFMAREREIFSLYANYAATALDLVTSLAESRRSNATASALLNFSRALSRVGTTDEVSQTLVDTVPAVAGCHRASVMLWDPVEQALVFKAISGREPPRQAHDPGDLGGDNTANDTASKAREGVDFTRMSVTDSPMVTSLMGSRDIVVVDRSLGDPYLDLILDRFGVEVSVLAPLFSDEEFLGVVSADFAEAPAKDPRRDRHLHERLRALADQAVTAFQNAWLLEQVGHLAWHDALTGLPNRRLLEDRVYQEFERAKRVKEPSTMFFVDLDRFKTINDSYGHAAGDDLICQVAGRLREVVRRQDTVARLGGDEFAILLPGLDDSGSIRQLAERMLDSLHRPFVINGTEITTSVSIGVATHADQGESYDQLLSHADEAMYRAKNLGRNTYQVFSDDYAAIPHDVDLSTDLQKAVEHNELFVLYQPYIDLGTNKVAGVEALVRWRHPARGVLEPGAFLPYAEGSDLIVEIDEFVIKEAARQVRTWLARGLDPLQMSVNVSIRDLAHRDFVAMVITALQANEVPPGRFEIEISEQDARNDDVTVRSTIETLRAHGVRVTVNHRPTADGPSQQGGAFPVRTLKINQSFVQMLGPSQEIDGLASAIVEAARRLGLDCVVDGDQHSHQSRVLLQRGSTAQGYFFSPPLFPGDVERMLEPVPVAAAPPPSAPPPPPPPPPRAPVPAAPAPSVAPPTPSAVPVPPPPPLQVQR